MRKRSFEPPQIIVKLPGVRVVLSCTFFHIHRPLQYHWCSMLANFQESSLFTCARITQINTQTHLVRTRNSSVLQNNIRWFKIPLSLFLLFPFPHLYFLLFQGDAFPLTVANHFVTSRPPTDSPLYSTGNFPTENEASCLFCLL